MGLLDNLEPVEAKKSCRVRTVLEGLDESDAQILRDALANEAKFSDYRLMVALRSRGVSLTGDAIHRHRGKVCSC